MESYGTGPRTGRKRKSLFRRIGNFLIVIGALLVLSLGAYEGYLKYQEASLQSRFTAENDPELKPQKPKQVAPPLATLSPTVASQPSPTSTVPATPAVDVGRFLPVLSDPPKATPETPKRDYVPPVRIVIPKIGLDSEIVEVGWKTVTVDGQTMAEWDVADYAVGHHQGTGVPGQPGNIILAGHNDINGEVFRYLENLAVGDEINLYTAKGEYKYMIARMELVQEVGASEEQRRDNAKFMDPTPDETLTLITCWPYWVDTHRIIVIAKPAK
ncbi:MAG: sortase [Chloroflexi bacterium]|nr:sortase [Chloroflexota bacterium]